MQEMQFQPLDLEDLLEEEMATHSRILAWKIPWTEKLGGLQSKGLQRVGHDLAAKQQHLIYQLKTKEDVAKGGISQLWKVIRHSKINRDRVVFSTGKRV